MTDQEIDDQGHPKYVWHFTEEQPCPDCDKYDKKVSSTKMASDERRDKTAKEVAHAVIEIAPVLVWQSIMTAQPALAISDDLKYTGLVNTYHNRTDSRIINR